MAILHREIAVIKCVILHCSASDRPEDDDISVIDRWHKERGLDKVGYHYFIRKSGVIQKGRKLFEIGAHCKGQNTASVGVCLSGNHKFTEAQFKSAALIFHDLYEILPNLGRHAIFPHFLFNHNKTCPNFSVKELLKFNDVQLSELKKLESGMIG